MGIQCSLRQGVGGMLQVGTAVGAKATVSQVVQQVLQEGGLSGFYRGYGVGVLRAVPMSALSFGTYELVRAWLAVQSGVAPAGPQNKRLGDKDDQQLQAS